MASEEGAAQAVQPVSNFDFKVERSYSLNTQILEGLSNGLPHSSVRLAFSERFSWPKDGDRLHQVLAASKLVYLELYVCGTMNNMALAETLAGSSSLCAFRMDDAREVSSGFLAAILACKTLRKITLARCNVRGEGLELLQTAIPASSLDSIVLVDVDFGGAGGRGRSRSEDAFVLPFLEACLSRRSCTLSNVRVSDETCQRLGEGFAAGKYPVEELQISGNALSAAGRAALEAGATRAPKPARFCIEGKVLAAGEPGAAPPGAVMRIAVSGEPCAPDRETNGLMPGMLTPLELPISVPVSGSSNHEDGDTLSDAPASGKRSASARGPSPMLGSPLSASGRPRASPVPRASPRALDDTGEPPAKRAANAGSDLSDGGSAHGSERSGIHKRSPFYNVTPAQVLSEDPKGFPKFDIPERYRRHRILKIGELVWGQGGGFPFWPAQVTRMNGVTKDRLYSIQYVDQDRTEQYTSDEMVRFDIGLELFGGMRITNREMAEQWATALLKARKLRQKQPDDPPRRAPSQGLVDKQERLELMHRRKKHLMSSLKHPGRSGRGRCRRSAGSDEDEEADGMLDDGSDVLSVDSHGAPFAFNRSEFRAAAGRRVPRKPRVFGADDEEEGGAGSGAESDGGASQDTLGSIDPTERLNLNAGRRRRATRRAAAAAAGAAPGGGRLAAAAAARAGDQLAAARALLVALQAGRGAAAAVKDEPADDDDAPADDDDEVEDLVADDPEDVPEDLEAGRRTRRRRRPAPAPQVGPPATTRRTGRRPPAARGAVGAGAAAAAASAARFGQLAELELPVPPAIKPEPVENPAIAKIKREGGVSPRGLPGTGPSPRGPSPRGVHSPRVAQLQAAEPPAPAPGAFPRVGSFHALLEASSLMEAPVPPPVLPGATEVLPPLPGARIAVPVAAPGGPCAPLPIPLHVIPGPSRRPFGDPPPSSPRTPLPHPVSAL
eukprot:tig00020553_g10549.t1